MKMLGRLGDRLLSAVVPATTATASCTPYCDYNICCQRNGVLVQARRCRTYECTYNITCYVDVPC